MKLEKVKQVQWQVLYPFEIVVPQKENDCYSQCYGKHTVWLYKTFFAEEPALVFAQYTPGAEVRKIGLLRKWTQKAAEKVTMEEVVTL